MLTAPQIWGSFRKRQRPGLSSRRGRGEAPLPELSARNFRRFIYRSLSDLFKKCIGCSTIGLWTPHLVASISLVLPLPTPCCRCGPRWPLYSMIVSLKGNTSFLWGFCSRSLQRQISNTGFWAQHLKTSSLSFWYFLYIQINNLVYNHSTLEKNRVTI